MDQRRAAEPLTTPGDAGFGLVEVLVAMLLIIAATLPLMTATALSARRLIASQDQFIASQRAAEAVESVFKARDNRVLTWAQIRNVNGASGSDGGVFLTAPATCAIRARTASSTRLTTGRWRRSSCRGRTASSARRTTRRRRSSDSPARSRFGASARRSARFA